MPDCLVALGPDAVPCDADTCYDESNHRLLHMACLCIDWQGNPIPNCSPKTIDYPVQLVECRNGQTGEVRALNMRDCAALGAPWEPSLCFCCCSGGFAAMAVGAPGASRTIGELAVGDQVLAGHGAGQALSWHPATVSFSAAAPPASAGTAPAPLMIHVEFGDGQTLIASPAQLFLLPGGKLKRADQLVPGGDSLVDRAGAALPIHRLATGYYQGAIQHFATEGGTPSDWDGRLDGHLVELNGVVAGDYILQLLDGSDKMKPHLADAAAPSVGTDAYKAAAPAVRVTPYIVGESAAPGGAEATSPAFAAVSGAEAVIPSSAVALFSAAEEQVLAGPGVARRGFSDQTNVSRAHYYLTLFGAFFPHVDVTVDWGNQRPNVFAYHRMMGSQVVVTGGFLRLQPIFGEAVAVAMAFGIANRTIVADAASVGHSLYDAVGVILPQALQGGDLAATLAAAQNQYAALFALVDAAATRPDAPGSSSAAEPPPAVPAGGPARQGLDTAGLAQVIDAAISGDDLPACAG